MVAPTAPSPAPTQAFHSGPAPSPSHLIPISPPHLLPPLSPTDSTLLLRLFALAEDYPALAAELASSPSLLSALSLSSPPDLLDLLSWSSRPDIAAWIALHRAAADQHRRTLALTALESVLKSTEGPIEKRRAATTLLRALDGRWSRPRNTGSERSSMIPPSPRLDGERWSRLPLGGAETGEGRARVRTDSHRSYAPPPPPISLPAPNSTPHAELAAIKSAFAHPDPSIALATLHAHIAPHSAPHSAQNASTAATFAGMPVPRDAQVWTATAQAALPTGFHLPMILSERRETHRSDRTSTWDIRARNTSKDQFRCTLSLIRDGPDTPNPCWRLASFDIHPNNSG